MVFNTSSRRISTLSDFSPAIRNLSNYVRSWEATHRLRALAFGYRIEALGTTPNHKVRLFAQNNQLYLAAICIANNDPFA